ncbi:MAG TPA: immunity 22 family protein [Hymenobacter sp.]|uniref:immunity 22 family protein n=1 Tax=Hymenobacter sp. TaxID=1898978 RepID=UPI002ED8547C
MDTIHIWIGLSRKSAEEFYAYFAINPVDRDAGIGASQFDKDVGTKWYDDDLIGTYYNENIRDLATAVEELPLASKTAGQLIMSKCQELGIDEANALFYYTDSDLSVADSAKKYNGLAYLGAFDNR